jgi:PAP2 superfamily C-terminal
MVLVACVATSVSDDPIFSAALWSMVVLDYAVEIYEGFHYSVDMWLGMVLVTLLWKVLYPVEGVANDVVGSSQPSYQPPSISTRTVLAYVPPALVTYLQLIVLPQATANILILLFAGTTVVIYFQCIRNEVKEAVRQAFVHYTQHILLCLLFMALGIYL